MDIALIGPPDRFTLADVVLPGNTLDQQPLGDFLAKIERQYGKADRVWVMDRGIPTEETLALMRASDPPHYLVGTPKARLTTLAKAFLAQLWKVVREQVTVKLLRQDGEVDVLALSGGRRNKEQAMRQRRLKRLWKRLQELHRQAPSRDHLLLKLGAAQKEAGRAYGLVKIRAPSKEQAVTADTFTFTLNRNKLRLARRREGHYLLRPNLASDNPAQLWAYYITTHRGRAGLQGTQG